MFILKSYKNYVFSAMFAALVLMATMFIQVPSINGYVHIGDSIVYLAAAFLPMPFSILAAGLGAALADAMTPYIVYAPFTFVIKGLMAACFWSKSEKILSKRNIIALPIAGIINIAGYALTEFIILSVNREAVSAAFATSLATVYGNLIQSITASVIFVIVALALDKMNFKKALEKIQ